VTYTTTTTVTSPVIVKKVNNKWVTILLAIITNLAKGFHWLASKFTFKPETQVQADFYVPIVEWGWNYNFGTRVFVLPNGVAVVYNGTTTVTATIVNGTTTTVTTVTLTGNNTVYWTVIVHGTPVEWTLHDSYNYYVNGNGNATGVFYISGVTDTLTLTAPPTCTINPSSTVTVIAGTGSNTTFIIECPPSAVNSTTTTATGTSTGTGTVTSPPPTTTTVSQGWELLVSVNDPWTSVEYSISDNFGNGLIGSGPLRYYPFHTYPYSVSQVTLTASIINEPSGWECSIAPSTTVVNQPSNPLTPATVTFTVSCVTPTPTSTPTSTPPPTTTPTSTPTTTPTSTPPSPTSTPTSTSTPISTTSSPSPTTVTSITTVTTPIPKVVNDYAMGCAPGNVPLGSEVAFECFIALNGYAGIQAVAQGSVQGGAYETATLTYTVNGQTATPGGVIGSWYWSGSCPRGTELVFQASNMNNVWNLNGVTDTTIIWYVTVTAYCQPKGALFVFFSTWVPPEVPITWVLRGGTDVESVITPLYLKAWDAYVEEWLALNGPMLDLLILLALVLPVLVKPATRRIRLT